MASEEHKKLATVIKHVHGSLRELTKEKGHIEAWEEHTQNTQILQEYADAMMKLATIWEDNSSNGELQAKSRIQWIIDYCITYFLQPRAFLERRHREERVLESLSYNRDKCKYFPSLDSSIRILDVGSCFNPFQDTNYFDVTAIDLCPATDSVLRGDFLKIPVIPESSSISSENGSINSLPAGYFHCVVFSLLLEYIPSSEQRISCCKKAFELLTYEGILIIITPDSQHVGKNAAIMKNWRYTLATMGFTRIKFEKLPHITCMVFRKAIDERLAIRWAETHKESYMKISIDIPQDRM